MVGSLIVGRTVGRRSRIPLAVVAPRASLVVTRTVGRRSRIPLTVVAPRASLVGRGSRIHLAVVAPRASPLVGRRSRIPLAVAPRANSLIVLPTNRCKMRPFIVGRPRCDVRGVMPGRGGGATGLLAVSLPGR
jgi:hypothetical protein